MKILQKTVWYVMTVCLATIIVFPLLWMVLTSFKFGSEMFTTTLRFFPTTWTLENYKQAWEMVPWNRFFVNTFFISISVVMLQITTCTLAGYALSVLAFPGQSAIFLLILGSNMIPFESSLIPSYLLIVNFGWLNTYKSLIVPASTSGLGIFIMRQNFKSIPKELFEASEMDNATNLQRFFKIALPLSKTSIATIALFAFMNSWNSYIWPLTVTSDTNMRTLQVGLSYMVDSDLGIQWGPMMSAATFIIIPMLIVFLSLQRFFVKGLMRTGIK